MRERSSRLLHANNLVAKSGANKMSGTTAETASISQKALR